MWKALQNFDEKTFSDTTTETTRAQAEPPRKKKQETNGALPTASKEDLTRRTVFAALHTAAAQFMVDEAELPHAFGNARTTASVSKIFEQWNKQEKFLQEENDETCLEDMGCFMKEIRLLWKELQQRDLIPEWISKPTDHGYVRHNSSDFGYCEQGNEIWEALFYMAGFQDFVDVEVAFKVPNDEYGQSSNKSAKGSFNLRGNIVESMFGHLHKQVPEKLQQRPKVAAEKMVSK